MSNSQPVVVYGTSNYTGRLVAEYLRECNLPFIAAGRNAERMQDALDHIPGIETADYEVEHSADALTERFRGAKVVCFTAVRRSPSRARRSCRPALAPAAITPTPTASRAG